MLCELKVSNLALIESLELVFPERSGLVVMTGETGAGKSIMTRAIKLLTGARASTDWVRSGAESCTVEALFEINEKQLVVLEMLRDAGMDDGTTIIIKRVINSGGRSKVYINGSMATTKLAGEITLVMLNMASQHDHQQFLQPTTHLDCIDNYGDLMEERLAFSHQYLAWKEKHKELSELRASEQDKEQRKDFLEFQLDEIRQADIKQGEDEALATEKARLKSGDTLLKLSQQSFSILSEKVNDELSELRKNLGQLAQLDPAAEKLAEDIIDYSYQGEEYAQRIREYRDSLEINPLRLDQVTERIDLLHQLKRKYGETLEQVLLFAQEAESELAQLENLEVHLDTLEKEVKQIEEKLLSQARSLQKKRIASTKQFERAMAVEMESLAFEQAAIEVRWQPDERTLEHIRPTGWDLVEFYFSANPGEPARPLAKVASGGELSRILLALKCVLAKKDPVDTVIFDEVDAGIGGEAAEAVARKIQQLANHHQVVCITHLPQIAARGSDHFVVSKSVEQGRTISSIRRLNEKERSSEVARMLAGQSVTAETEAWATELLRKGA